MRVPVLLVTRMLLNIVCLQVTYGVCQLTKVVILLIPRIRSPTDINQHRSISQVRLSLGPP